MASQEHPLLSLEPAKQQQLVDLVESNDIDALATKTGLTRRQILGIGATLAGSGALGAYAATEAIDPAQAQADTGDSDGNVGLPADRVDVFADGIDTNSLSTDELLNEGDILVIGSTGNLIKRIDPANSTSPIADELAADRTFILPYGNVTDDTLSGPFPERVSIVGPAQGGSILNVSNTIDIGSSRVYLDGFTLSGPGDNAAALDALDIGGLDRGCIGYPRGLGIRDYYGRGLFSSSAAFENTIGRIYFANVDAGDSAGVVDLQNFGPANHIVNITSYASSTTSGVNSTILNLNHTGELVVENLTIGGVAGVAVEGTAGLPNQIGTVNYEPTSQPGGTPAYALKLASGTSVEYINLFSSDSTVDYVAEFTDRAGAPTAFGTVGNKTATINNSLVNVSGDPGAIVEFDGSVGDVDNTTGNALTWGVWCKGGLTKKRSTGTGYDGGTEDARI